MSVPRSGSTSLGSAEVYIQGTLRYMAPEALQGRTTKKVDVYAFAMTAYEIFTGECPFLTIPDGYFFNYILQDKGRLPRPEEKLVADRGLNDEMWHLMMECSAYSPNDRPNFDSIATTTEMLKDEWQQTAQANTAPVVVTPADDLDELEDLLDGIQIHTTNVSNQNVQNQVGFSDIRNIAGSSSPPDHSMTLSSDTQSSSEYTSGQFQSLFGSQDQNRFGSPGTPMTTAGLTLANTPSPWLNSPPASNLTPDPFVSSRTLPPTPIGTYPTLPREEALARRMWLNSRFTRLFLELRFIYVQGDVYWRLVSRMAKI
ncbi:hypothetical protein FRC03_007633 [Tulasnella sp. 419]|nr:hypothetical protein FRC03_007633 [Tulasnella sp. 419]